MLGALLGSLASQLFGQAPCCTSAAEAAELRAQTATSNAKVVILTRSHAGLAAFATQGFRNLSQAQPHELPALTTQLTEEVRRMVGDTSRQVAAQQVTDDARRAALIAQRLWTVLLCESGRMPADAAPA